MPDPLTALSTAASVVSLVDVTIRACEGIYGLVISWRNAPRAVKSLRQTVEGIESILRSLKTFVTEYESSVAFRQHRQVLPDSVNADIISIGETLGLLDGILTSSGETKNVRRRAKWAIDEKKTLEIVQRLETQQVVLILSLQTVAQRSSIARHHDMFRIETNLKQSHAISTEQVLNALKPISRRLDVIAQNEASASMGHAPLSTSIEALRETNLDLHNTLDGKLDNLMSGLSQAPFLRDSIRSEIFVRPSTNDVLARIFREELKHVVIPIVEDRLKANKSASEAQIVSIRESIHSMANEFQQSLQSVSRSDANTAYQDSVPEKEGLGRETQEHIQSSAATSLSIGQYPEAYREICPSSALINPAKRLWTHTWCFRWRVGSLHVRASAFQMHSCYQTFSNAYQISHIGPKIGYKLQMTFIPAQCLLTLRGISISCRSQRDQRGYLELCPILSSFAVIPYNSDVFSFSAKGDLEGLRQLFFNRVGSPTDRDEDGWTPLHYAARAGNYEICKFLLTEGADPLALATSGRLSRNCLDLIAHTGSMFPVRGCGMPNKVDYCAAARLLHNAGYDLNDGNICRLLWFPEPPLPTRLPQLDRRILTKIRNLNYEDSDELFTFLRCQVLEVDDVKADELAEQLRDCLNFTPFFESAGIGYGTYDTQITYFLCGLGANVRARDASGRQPLHCLFQKPWSDETSCHVIYLAYLLIKTGADIWACDDPGNTPTSLVLKHDRWDDWCKILERCGLDVEHVLRTERDNRWNRQHLNDAERSGVDTEDLEFPAHEVSLRRRGAYTWEVNG